MARIAVTGASGFIGAHLLGALVREGHDPAVLNGAGEGPQGRACALADAIRRGSFDAVIHLAAPRRREWIGDPVAARAFDQNLALAEAVMDAVAAASTPRLVLIGSAAEYGDQAGPWREDLPCAAVSAYGRAKAAVTRLALDRFEREGLPVVVLRPFTVYGSSQPLEMFVGEALDHIRRRQAFHVRNGRQARDFVHVADVARAIVSAATKPGLEGRVINVGSGRATRVGEAAQTLWRIARCPAPLTIGETGGGDVSLTQVADTRRAAALLGWSATMTLEAGLRECLEGGAAHAGALVSA